MDLSKELVVDVYGRLCNMICTEYLIVVGIGQPPGWLDDRELYWAHESAGKDKNARP